MFTWVVDKLTGGDLPNEKDLVRWDQTSKDLVKDKPRVRGRREGERKKEIRSRFRETLELGVYLENPENKSLL